MPMSVDRCAGWVGRASWAAMNADESRPRIRRGRPVEKKALPVGPARDLRDAIYLLYAEADRPQLEVLAKQIAQDDSLPGSPGKDLIGKIISGDGHGSQQDTVTVTVALARAAGRSGLASIAERIRQMWMTAVTAEPPAPESVPWMAARPDDALVTRAVLLDQLRALLLREDFGPIGVTGLYGAGGFGKTTLAQQASRLPELRDRFPGGMLWVTVGQAATGAALASILVDLIEQLSGARPGFVTPAQAGHHLGMLLDDRPPMLLIVDDVWHDEQLEPFLTGGATCTRLITTRVHRLLPAGAPAVEVDEMVRGEAAALLERSLPGIPPRDVTTLLDLTGRWPLLMALANGALRRRIGQGEPLTNAVRAVVRQLSVDGPTVLDLGVLARRERAVDLTVRASLDLLAPDDQRRFLELAIFGEDVVVPDRATTLLWTRTGVATSAAAERLRTSLADLALVQRQADGVRLHDVIRAYLRSRLTPPELVALHAQFLDAARPLAAGPWWRLPPAEPYLWRHLCYHLAEAQRPDELAATATDLHWIATKAHRGGVAVVETDLVRVPDERAAVLRTQLSRSAHLLTAITPAAAFDDVLIARLTGVASLADAVHAFAAEQRSRPGLTAAWPVPDLGPASLERVIATGVGWLNSCAISPASAWLAVGSRNGLLIMYRWTTGEKLAQLPGHSGAINSVAVTFEQAWIVTAGDDGTFRLWDAARRRPERILWTGGRRLVWCAAAPGSDRVAAVSKRGDLWIGEIASGRTLLSRRLHSEPAFCAFTGDDTVISADESGAVTEHDLRTGRSRPLLRTDAAEHVLVTAMAIDPIGSSTAVTDIRDDILIFPLDGSDRRSWMPLVPRMSVSRPAARLTGHVGMVHAIEAATDRIFSGGGDGTIRAWDPRSGRQLSAVHAHTSWVTSCTLTADQRRLISTGTDATVRVWNVDQLLHERLDGHVDWVNTGALSPDGTEMATAGNDGTVRLWQTANGRSVPIWEPDGAIPIHRCAFSSDGRWLATNGDVVLIRTAEGWATSQSYQFENGFTSLDCVIAPDDSLVAWRGSESFDAAGLNPRIEVRSAPGAPDRQYSYHHPKNS